jgi:hypothetical protein
MRKITILLFSLCLLVSHTVLSQTLVKTPILIEDFESAEAPWGFSTAPNVTTSIETAKAPRTGNALQWYVNNAGGGRTTTKQLNNGNNLSVPADGIVKLDFNWQLGVPTNRNTSGIFLRFKDSSGNISIAFSAESTQGSGGNALHYVNLDNTVTNDATAATTRIAPEGGNFVRDSWVSIHASLNFNTKVVDTLIITNGIATYTSYGQAFYSNAASGIAIFEMYAHRDGANMIWTGQLDNFEVYYYQETSGSADVTINYIDQYGEVAKMARVAADQPIGTTYSVSADDKFSFTANGSYYAYDAASTAADNVEIAEGGSVINLKFKKSPLTTGTYTWTGTTGGNWNELDENFSTDGVNTLGYQNENAIAFTDAGATKALTLTGALNTGAENVTLEGVGYAISGSGSLNGTGAFILNLSAGQTASLNIINNLTGGIVVNGGTAVLLRDAAATSVTLANGAALNVSTGATFNKAIAGSGTVTVIPGSTTSYSSNVSGVDQLIYELVSTGSVNTSGAFSGMPVLNNTVPASAVISVTTKLEDAAMFGSTISFASSRINLGDNIDLVYAQNPAADGSTVVAIGELSGAPGSKVKGTRIGRTVTYNVGGLNTNSTYGGTFENFGLDAWGNISTLNLTKSGTGILSLSGENTGYVQGSVNVAEGELEVTGALATATVPLTVAVDATLSGSGVIAGNTTVNGTLKGGLTFGNNLVLNGTTELAVTGFEESEFDVLTVGGLLTAGGTLRIHVTATAPAVGTKIKLINASSITGIFNEIHLPSGYDFDEANGELSYSFITSLDETTAFRIYPTLVTNEVIVEGSGIHQIALYDITGQRVKITSALHERNILSMSQLESGTYLLKVGFEDGSIKVQRIVLQK